VSWRVWSTYLSAVGWGVCALVVVSLVAMQVGVRVRV
jgi:hypothetical protein